MKTLILISIFLLGSSFIEPKRNLDCLNLDIVLIVDVSSSVYNIEDKEFIVNAFKSFIKKFEMSKTGVRISLITFATEAKIVSHLTSEKGFVLSKISEIKGMYLGPNTYLQNALRFTLGEFDVHGRERAKKFAIIISDGDVGHPKKCFEIADEMVLNDIKICSIYVENRWTKKEFMQAISSGCYASSEYKGIAYALSTLNECF